MHTTCSALSARQSKPLRTHDCSYGDPLGVHSWSAISKAWSEEGGLERGVSLGNRYSDQLDSSPSDQIPVESSIADPSVNIGRRRGPLTRVLREEWLHLHPWRYRKADRGLFEHTISAEQLVLPEAPKIMASSERVRDTTDLQSIRHLMKEDCRQLHV